MDIYQVEYMHEEYERRVKAALLVRAALDARAARAEATAQQDRLVTGLVTTLRRWQQRIVRHWSGQPEATRSLPINYKL